MPLLAFAVVSTTLLHGHERERREHALRDTARALSLAVDRELRTRVVALEALATSVDLDRSDLRPFRRDAARFMAAQPGWSNLTVFDRGGDELAAFGATRGISEEIRAAVREVAVSGRPSVSDLGELAPRDAPVVTLSVPVVRDGRIRHVLTADVPPVQITGLLRAQHLDDWLGVILDRRGQVLARSPRSEGVVGRPAGPELMEHVRAAPEGSFRGRAPDGVEGLMAYSRAPFTGWTIAVMVPPGDLGPSARRSLGGLIGLGVVLGGVAVALALLLGRRIATSMAELSATARALGRGNTPPPVTSGIAEVNAVSASMQEASMLLAERAEERRRAEAALHERDERLGLALSAGEMVTWDWDLAAGTIRWGDEIAVVRGAGRPHAARVHEVLRLVHPDDRALLHDTAGRAAKDGTACEAEFRVRFWDGTPGWLAVRGRAFRDAAGVPTQMLGVAMDVTARKRAEEASIALAAIVQSSDDAIIGMTCEGRIVSWNGGAERVYGYTADEMEGVSLAILYPPEQPDTLTPMLARVRSGEHVEQADAVRLRKDGTRVDVSVMMSPIRDAGERIIGVSTIARDVTEQRRTARRLAALAADHARLFEAERAARADAETANRLKDQFLATLSHELRTPLTSMLGWVRMLRSGRLDDAMAGRALESIERSTRAQSQLIDDLLDVSRIVSGKLTMNIAAVDADEVVTSALDAVRPLAESRSIELVHESPGRRAIVNGDAGRLQQVIGNLLSNAIKFTPDGGRVRAEVIPGETELTITVRDTGKGIAPELLPEIFERFRQGAPTRTQGGLGLGLAIVRHLVDLHGGRVAAQSDGVGRGATFAVHLPLADLTPAAPSPRETSTEFPRLDGVRVLLVDDEPDARALLGTVLEQCGAAVAAVSSAAAALEELRRDRYDVLLSDISMPEEDGYQLMQKVRALNPRLPAAAVTAFARAEDREAALAAGFQLHVAKPVEPVALARAVKSLVRRAA